MLLGCGAKQPIHIGYSGSLTGATSDLGVGGREGAELAVETINAAGGIDGRPLLLVTKDDKGDPDTARQVDRELAEEGVVALIGHMTSGQTAAVFEQNNAANLVMISPTSSSEQFSNQADHFFRVISSIGEQNRAWGDFIHEQGVRHLVGIYDTKNQAFAEPVWRGIQERFTQLGGEAEQVFTFTSGESDLQALVEAVRAADPEAITIIAPALDAALLVQYSEQQALDAQLFVNGWAQTDEFLNKGGQAVEQLEMLAVYDPAHPSPRFQAFSQAFERRYGHRPNLAASHSYEAVLLLAEGLRQTRGEAEGLPEALATVGVMEGLQGLIAMNEYGDARRDLYVVRVEQGQFKVVDTLTLAR